MCVATISLYCLSLCVFLCATIFCCIESQISAHEQSFSFSLSYIFMHCCCFAWWFLAGIRRNTQTYRHIQFNDVFAKTWNICAYKELEKIHRKMSVKIHMFKFITTFVYEYQRRKRIQLLYPFSWFFFIILFFCTGFRTSHIFYLYWDRGYHLFSWTTAASYCRWTIWKIKKKLWCVQYVNKNIDLSSFAYVNSQSDTFFWIPPAFEYMKFGWL